MLCGLVVSSGRAPNSTGTTAEIASFDAPINGASHFPGGATLPRSVRMYTMFRMDVIDDVVRSTPASVSSGAS